MKLRYAFVRRGIAFTFAQLMTFDQHSSWISFLFNAMHRDAPPGYAKPSLHQVMQCDKMAWTRLGATQSTVKQHADGTFPLGEALLALRADPVIALCLAPLARTPARVAAANGLFHILPPVTKQTKLQPQVEAKERAKAKRLLCLLSYATSGIAHHQATPVEDARVECKMETNVPRDIICVLSRNAFSPTAC